MFVPALSTNPRPAIVLHTWLSHLQCVVAGEVMLQKRHVAIRAVSQVLHTFKFVVPQPVGLTVTREGFVLCISSRQA